MNSWLVGTGAALIVGTVLSALFGITPYEVLAVTGGGLIVAGLSQE